MKKQIAGFVAAALTLSMMSPWSAIAASAKAIEETNLALNPSNVGFPQVFASYTNGGDKLFQLVDGVISYEDDASGGPKRNRWTNYGSPTSATDYVGTDFGSEQLVSKVELCVYNDGGGVQPPAAVTLEYFDGEWKPIPNVTAIPTVPAAGANTFLFDEISASKIRAKLSPKDPGKVYVGLTELEVYGKEVMPLGYKIRMGTQVHDEKAFPLTAWVAESKETDTSFYLKATDSKGGLVENQFTIPAGSRQADFTIDVSTLASGQIIFTSSPTSDYTQTMTFKATKKLSRTVIEEIYEEVKTPYEFGIVLRNSGEAGTFDEQLIDNPNVFRMPGDDEHFYMTYVGHDGSGYRTGIARSTDFLSWEKIGMVLDNGTVEGAWDRYNAAGYIVRDHQWGEVPTPHITKDGKYAMTYLASDTAGYEAGIKKEGVAFTDKIFKEDGIVNMWDRHPTPVLEPQMPYEAGAIWKMQAIWDGSRYVGFYNAGTGPEAMCQVYSDDLINWTREESNPVVTVDQDAEGNTWGGSHNADADVVKIGDKWVMFYFTSSQYGVIDSFAVSEDMVNWTKSYMPLRLRDQGYNSTYAHKPCVLQHNGVTYHFYNAVGNEGRQIALGTSIDLSVIKTAQAIQAESCTPEQYAKLQEKIQNMQANLRKQDGSKAEVEKAIAELTRVVGIIEGTLTENEVETPDAGLINGKAGTKVNVPLMLSGIKKESGLRAIETVVTIPENFSVSNVTADEQFKNYSVDWQQTGDKLRLAVISTDINTIAYDPLLGDAFILELMLMKDMPKGETAKVIVDRVTIKNAEESVEYDVSKGESNIESAGPQEVTAEIRELYLGDGSDLIPVGKTAVAVELTGPAVGKNYTLGEYPLYYSEEKTKQSGKITFVGIIDTADKETLTAEQVLPSDQEISPVKFGDTNNSGGLDAQDALNILSAWLRKTEAPDNKMTLIMNVSADERIDTSDAIAIVDNFVDGTALEIIKK